MQLKKLHNPNPKTSLPIPDQNLFKVESKKQETNSFNAIRTTFLQKKSNLKFPSPVCSCCATFEAQKRTSNLKIIVCEFQFVSSGDEKLYFRFLLTSVQGQRTSGRVIMDMPCENWTQLSHQPTKLASRRLLRSETL